MQVLVTRRLTLRPPLEVDADALAHHLTDERVAGMLAGVPAPYTQANAQAWISGRVEDHSAGCTFCIIRHALIGVVGVRAREGAYHLGYWLAADHWGQGLMSEAARAVLSYSFCHLAVDSITSGAFTDNHASVRVLEKLGFREDGVGRAVSGSGGKERETKRMVLQRSVFEANSGPLQQGHAA